MSSLQGCCRVWFIFRFGFESLIILLFPTPFCFLLFKKILETEHVWRSSLSEFLFFRVLYVFYFFTFSGVMLTKLFLFNHHLNLGSVKRKSVQLRNNFSP